MVCHSMGSRFFFLERLGNSWIAVGKIRLLDLFIFLIIWTLNPHFDAIFSKHIHFIKVSAESVVCIMLIKL